jgi:hypothetical protein
LIRTSLNNNGTLNIILAYLKAGNLSQSVQIQTSLNNNATVTTGYNTKAFPGVCSSGQFVNKTTTGGVVCNFVQLSTIVGGTFATGNYVFGGLVQAENLTLEDDPTNHFITDNTTCTIIRGDNARLEIC